MVVRRLAAVVAFGCAAVAGMAPASAEPVAACAAARVTTALPAATPMLDWSENVGYDRRGNLWVSRLYRNEVQRYDNTGKLTATVPVAFPGAVRLGPDGLLYVVYGDAPSSAIIPGGVVRFDPDAVHPHPEVFAAGFTMPNGAAFDDAGNLYVAATGSGVIRIGRDGAVDRGWTDRAVGAGANGIAVRGDTAYLTTNANPLGRVLSFPIEAPESRTVLADLSTGSGVPDFADDLHVDAEGVVYVTTLSGSLVRIDTRSGGACSVLSTEPLTAVVPVLGRSDELLASTERGSVLRIRL
ncbi:SMP-30/gluconolactonase/LRE family protein [Nocardia sp. NPDC127579]|uniref:SMP-30/gluconolactonase/LRE family protein n=1 Tax=Nocardia sp. NPDC127579 TaxID=3345402 RepID=UPI003631C905